MDVGLYGLYVQIRTDRIAHIIIKIYIHMVLQFMVSLVVITSQTSFCGVLVPLFLLSSRGVAFLLVTAGI